MPSVNTLLVLQCVVIMTASLCIVAATIFALFPAGNKRFPLKAVGLLVVIFVLYGSLRPLIERVIPADQDDRHDFDMHSSGDLFDRRAYLAFLVAVLGAYLAVRGWQKKERKVSPAPHVPTAPISLEAVSIGEGLLEAKAIDDDLPVEGKPQIEATILSADSLDKDIENGERTEHRLLPEQRPIGPQTSEPKGYAAPSVALLDSPEIMLGIDREELRHQAERLLRTLGDLHIDATLGAIHVGPRAMRFEVLPGPGVRVETVMATQADLALALRAISIRTVMVPGNSALGIEITRADPRPVRLRGILESESWRASGADMPLAIGSSAEGRPILGDLVKMKHLLIAGATGSGKSVCVDSLVASVLYGCRPADVRFLMLDSKLRDLPIYNVVPHMLKPVLTEPVKIRDALQWLVSEMENG